MSRAAILGTNGQAFMMRYWLNNFKRWEDEVDHVYFSFSELGSWPEPEMEGYVTKMLEAHPKITVLKDKTSWPESYATAVRQSKEEKILILHDDVFIKKSGIVSECFDLLEEGKLVTPLHSIYNPAKEIEAAMERNYKQFPIMTNDFQRYGYSFLLYFLFVTRKDLMKTSLNFRGWTLRNGEYSSLLDVTSTSDWGADTGFVLELELLKNGVVIQSIPRFPLADIPFYKDPVSKVKELYENREGIFSMHVSVIDGKTFAFEMLKEV